MALLAFAAGGALAAAATAAPNVAWMQPLAKAANRIAPAAVANTPPATVLAATANSEPTATDLVADPVEAEHLGDEEAVAEVASALESVAAVPVDEPTATPKAAASPRSKARRRAPARRPAKAVARSTKHSKSRAASKARAASKSRAATASKSAKREAAPRTKVAKNDAVPTPSPEAQPAGNAPKRGRKWLDAATLTAPEPAAKAKRSVAWLDAPEATPR
jgi:hypothetical protein